MNTELTSEMIDDMIFNHVEKIVDQMDIEELVQFVTDDLIHNFSMMSTAELLELIEAEK